MPPAHMIRRRLAVHLAGAVTLATAATLVPGVAEATPWPGHPDRTIVRHAVRPGETATALAVRYHAWTAELLRLNHLGSNGTIYRGQVLRIPVVISAVRRARGQVPKPNRPRPSRRSRPRTRRSVTTSTKHRKHQHHAKPTLIHSITPRRGWLHTDLTRDQVRHLVTRMARRYDVPRTLALAIAWQESGWQQRRVSSAGALGVMQVMPDTGRWMRWYAGRPAAAARHPRQHPRRRHDVADPACVDEVGQQRDRGVLPRPRRGAEARLLQGHQAVRAVGASPPATPDPHGQPDLGIPSFPSGWVTEGVTHP